MLLENSLVWQWTPQIESNYVKKQNRRRLVRAYLMSFSYNVDSFLVRNIYENFVKQHETLKSVFC